MSSEHDRLAGGFFRHIEACNPPIEEPFVAWRVGEHAVGWLRPGFAEHLRQFPEVFEFDSNASLSLHPRLDSFDRRTETLRDVARQLVAEGVVTAYLDEPYPVTPAGREAALCALDRGVAAYFGLRTFGQHLNGYVRRDDGIHMWLGRRARDRILFPGALDNMVAGGLPQHLDMHDNLLKECEEEAGVPASLAATAVPVGVVSYNRVAERGLRRDVLYCYDLELPPDFVPCNTDGEVESFMLVPLEEAARLVSETDEFKLNCNLVVIDFLVRHGWLAPSSSAYLPLVLGLRRPLLERL
jgi:8-oxo-dGTP pyrophosphatase MutT (NUDIX family)